MKEKLFPSAFNKHLIFIFFSVDNDVNHFKIVLGQNRMLLKHLDHKRFFFSKNFYCCE